MGSAAAIGQPRLGLSSTKVLLRLNKFADGATMEVDINLEGN
jgi:hypothetical protein